MSSENKERNTTDKIKGKRHRTSGFEEWGGYMPAKKSKLAAQFAGQRDMEIEDQGEIKSDIFKGVSIFVNGYTKPSADELRRLMLIHGGTYHHYHSSKTTHTIASNLPHSKMKNLKNEIVVTADWITESIKAGKLLPHQDYLLCTPEMNKQQKLNFQNLSESKNSKDEASNNNKNCDKPHAAASPQDVAEDNSEASKDLPKNDILQNEIAKDTSSATISMQSENVNNIKSPSRNETPVTAGHPAFLSEFYSHSRLHHISTSKEELKRYVQNLVNNHDSKTFAGRENLKKLIQNGSIHMVQKDPSASKTGEKSPRVIMHLDMDCFFVSVGLRKHPELKGKPVAVTHSKGKRGGVQEGSDVHFEAAYYANQSKKKLEGLTSVDCNTSDQEEMDGEELGEKQNPSKYSKDYGSLSEIASCSYEAREAGVRNGMFLGEALRRCPTLKTISYDFEGYSEVSKQLYDIVISYTLDIEPVSCDELFIDCTELLLNTDISPLQFASILRAEIEQKTKCTASAGLGANMLLARLANRCAKPNGQYHVTNDQVEEFMVNQMVKDLPGVGYSTTKKFENMGVISCGDLQKLSLSKLQQEFGPKTGEALYKRCRGKDNRVVQLQKERKSVSAEINYGIRFEKEEEVFKFLKELSDEVVNRLHTINCKGKSISLKLMVRHPEAPKQTAKFMGHGVCDHIVKTISLKSATDDPALIAQECCTLARGLKIKPEDYRGIGIQLSKLEPIQKDSKACNSIDSFICGGTSNSELDQTKNQEIFAPKEVVKSPRINSIKDFLLDRPSANRQHIPPQYFPTVDQMDESVLNALPEDLQKEILEMYGGKNSPQPPSLFEYSTTSAPTMSTSKSNKSATKKSDAKNKIPSRQNTILDCMFSAKSNSTDDKEDEEETLFKKKASIGGAENINEVRNLVKEWVLSSQVVLEEDIDQFRDFILEVIDEDLKKADLILKYFHRVVSTANALWQQAYLTILSYVQQKMLQKFGTMLEAKCDFST